MFPERLRQVRIERGKTQEDVADYLGFSRPTYTAYESGRRKPDQDTLIKIAKYLNVSIDYLLGFSDVKVPFTNIKAAIMPSHLEIGNMLKELREKKGWTIPFAAKILGITKDELVSYENNEKSPDKNMVKRFAEAYANQKYDMRINQPLVSETGSTYDATNRKKLPILGTIKAGLPILAEEHREGEIEVPEHIGGDFALRVEGDSMVYAGIFPGDLAIMKSSNIAHHGQVVAAGVEEETWRANLKFFVQTNGKTLLRSANPNYTDIELTSRHRIIGTLVGLIRENVPTFNTYMQMILTRDELQGAWMEVIEAAMDCGLEPEHVKQLVEMQGAIAKKLKEWK